MIETLIPWREYAIDHGVLQVAAGVDDAGRLVISHIAAPTILGSRARAQVYAALAEVRREAQGILAARRGEP
jgi:hypothetical protein